MGRPPFSQDTGGRAFQEAAGSVWSAVVYSGPLGDK